MINLIWGFIIIFVIIITIWWLLMISSKKGKIKRRTFYADMEEDFESRSNKFYLSNNFIEIDVELRNSDFRYQIIDSDGEVLYDNRECKNRKKEEPPVVSFEVQQAISLKTSSKILRNKVRYTAFYISDNKDRSRVVRLSSLNAERQQVILSR